MAARVDLGEAKIAVTVVPALVIRPGDEVLLNFHTEDLGLVRRVVAALEEKFPGVRFTALGGAGLTLIQREGDGELPPEPT